MRILLIRHGDPDYERDALTEKGKVEAALLAERMAKEDVTDFYVSPLGRARETAEYTLNKTGRTARVLDWLQEFPAKVDINESEALQRAYPDTEKEGGVYRKRIAWDMVPSYWQRRPEYFTGDQWKDSEVAHCSDLNKVYEMVSAGVDELLAQYGYERENGWYRTRQGNRNTIALYCHFGATCAVLSHLWKVSPFLLWQNLAMAPTSVTEVFTEEREKGIVTLRASKIGDISHLYAGKEAPSFSARFCETFEGKERH